MRKINYLQLFTEIKILWIIEFYEYELIYIHSAASNHRPYVVAGKKHWNVTM